MQHMKPTWLSTSNWLKFCATPTIPVCGHTDRPLVIDHIMPRQLGGTNEISNLQWMCDRCNAQKGIGLDAFWAQPLYWDTVPRYGAMWGGQRQVYGTIIAAADILGRPISQNTGVLFLVADVPGTGKTLAMAVATGALQQAMI